MRVPNLGHSVPYVRQNTGTTAERVRAELEARQISGRALARTLGWKRSRTARRLNGSHPLTVDELAAIATYLGVPVASLIPGDEPRVVAS